MEENNINYATAPSVKPENSITAGNQRQTVNHKRSRRKNDHLIIVLLGITGVIAWIVFFTLGMLIDSSQYRATLSTNFRWFKFIMTMLTFTPSNIAILCLVSAFTGGCSSLLVIKKAQKALGLDDQTTTKKSNSQIFMNESPFSSMLRGILVFFAFLAGVFITSSNALTAPTAQAYTQAAGVVSMLAFLVGYDPTMFRNLINLTEKIKGSS